MAKQKRETSLPKVPAVSLDLRKDTKQSLAIVLLSLLGLLSALALLNISGNLGVVAVKGLRYIFGWGAFLLPLFFILIAFSLYKDLKSDEETKAKGASHSYVGIALLTTVVITFLQLVHNNDGAAQFQDMNLGQGGGLWGGIFGFIILKTIGLWAGFILLAAGALAAVLIAFNIPLNNLFSIFRKSTDDRDDVSTSDAPRASLKINDNLGTPAFKIEQVGKANPVAAAIKTRNMPKFMSKGKPASAERPVERPVPKIPDPNWKFPPVDLLDESNSNVDSGNIEANVAIIQKTLQDFDIEVEMGEVNIGPTVTQYTLRPAEGIRLSAIVALQNDLKLALAAPSIRIEAPIPGRSLVGIEVPNKSVATVRLRELFDTEDFQQHSSALAYVLGRDVAGKAIMEDLSKMPHLLIAGSTGSGKSVAMNVILSSFLMRNTPADVKFIIIDPKRVEMSLYNEIPHLITPVITDHQKAVNALRWTVAEMDRRYQLLSEARKRNIGEYNEVTPEKMHYLVVIVDELADLMTVARNDVEATIVRLAQMARAVGIHLILATQRPSVDIITGLIKANITSRMAFAVASQVDSRTILDQAGAEKLLGRGDMLYITSEMSQPKRIQGALIGEKEVKKITEYLKKQEQPSYNESVTEKVKVSASGIGAGGDMDDGDEPLLEEAKQLVMETGKASASYLQRRLKIGYARAARILDILEEHGVVGPAEGAKPREVYASSETSEEETDENQFNQI